MIACGSRTTATVRPDRMSGLPGRRRRTRWGEADGLDKHGGGSQVGGGYEIKPEIAANVYSLLWKEVRYKEKQHQNSRKKYEDPERLHTSNIAISP